MPRPGVDVTISEPTPTGGAVLDSAQGFLVGLAERGPVEWPARVRSLREYERRFGGRAGGVTLHDSARAFFSERGGTLHLLRLAGATAKVSEAEVGDLQVSSSSPGTWGNALKVGLEAEGGIAGRAFALRHPNRPKARAKATTRDDNGDNGDNGPAPNGTNPTGPVRVVVTDNGVPVERSSPITTVEQAIDWARLRSSLVTIAADEDDVGNALDAVAAVALTGGVEDRNVTPTIVGDAFDHFGSELGPGQTAAPGFTDSATHGEILRHSAKTKRCALLDLVDDEVTMAADVMDLYGVEGVNFAQALAPRIVYPGPAPGTTVLVPYSAVQAGIIARQDGITGNPNQAAAGVNGVSLNARGIAADYTDDSREQLNELGITLAKVRFGTVRTYGGRTASDSPNWKWFGGSRVVMAIAFEADAVGEDYVLRQIDGRRHTLAELEVALGGICLRYFSLGALYGDTADEAFRVVADESLNSDETIEGGEILAAIFLRAAPPGEWVRIDITKMPVSMAI